MLLRLLERDGVDTSLIVRRDDVQTSASVLPIRPNGDRPAFHVIGANQTYGPATMPRGRRWPTATTCTSAGRSSWAARRRPRSWRGRARAARVTSADILAPGEGLLDWIGAALPQLDYLLPNVSRCWRCTGAGELDGGLLAS